MNNKLKRPMLVFLFLMLALLPVSNVRGQAKTLKIGQFVTFSGPGSEELVAGSKVGLMAVDWMNQKGGITIKGQKYQIELVQEDDKGSADGAIAATTRLIERHKVKFIIGGVVPFITQAVKQITEPAGVLRCVSFMIGVPEDMGPNTPYTFRTGNGLMDSIPGTFQYLVDAYPNVKTVVVVSPDDAAAPVALNRIKPVTQRLGLKLLGMEVYPWGTEDYFPLMTKVLSYKPDAICQVSGFSGMVAGVMKGARQLGFKGPVFCSSDPDIIVIRDIVGKNLATDFFNTDIVVDDPKMTPMIKEMQKMWVEKGNERKHGKLKVAAWNDPWVLVQAIEAAQSLEPAVVAKTLEQMENIQTPSGPGKMGGLKTYGINHALVKPLAISRIIDGKAEHVRWFTPEIP